MFKALWRYRHFVLSSVRNEYRGRFARSAFGGLWAFLNPLAEVAIYALILSNVLAARFDGIDNKYSFAIYLTSGILAWSLFANVVNRSLNLFIASGELIKKVHFPKVVLPATVVGVAIVDNLLLALAIAGVFTLLGHVPGLYVLWLPVLMGITLAFAISIGLILGILNVFIRDIGQVVPIALQFGFWLTPIVYPPHIIPESWRHWLMLNPMVPIVEAYHSVLAFGRPPELAPVLVVAASALFLLGLAFLMFMRASEEMADAL
ncbi:MAG: ABC transporter permease [Xanthomonadales bacterium]|nr:ABC transporter permease [Xanthomonadales bacterium]